MTKNLNFFFYDELNKSIVYGAFRERLLRLFLSRNDRMNRYQTKFVFLEKRKKEEETYQTVLIFKMSTKDVYLIHTRIINQGFV